MSVTIEYDGKLAEVPNSVWRRFEEEMADLDNDMEFLGEELDMVLDKEGYDKLVAVIEKSGSWIGARIIHQLQDPRNKMD
jgi:hypothetical protein